MQNVKVENMVKEALKKSNKHMGRNLNSLYNYYHKKWNNLNVNSNNNKINDIYKIKREFYSLRGLLREEMLDNIWERITSNTDAF